MIDTAESQRTGEAGQLAHGVDRQQLELPRGIHRHRLDVIQRPHVHQRLIPCTAPSSVIIAISISIFFIINNVIGIMISHRHHELHRTSSDSWRRKRVSSLGQQSARGVLGRVRQSVGVQDKAGVRTCGACVVVPCRATRCVRV
jgi:hypothetical protein